MAKKTGVRLGLKNLGIESGEATGLEEIFGVAATPPAEKKPRRKRKPSPKDQATADAGGPIFGEIDILAARPDVDQPRTLLPTSAYTAMDQGASPTAVLTDWFNTEGSASLAQQEEMREIKALAQTIAEAGLQQPIGIREVESKLDDVQYAVVFGERRWWAHVYLLSADNKALGQQIGKIKAGLVQPDNLQLVQLIENLHRRNLPPLDIAEGLKRSEEQLKASGVKNVGQKLEAATGIQRHQRSRYKHLLELAPSVQQKIRDYMLTENAVRPIADRLRKQPEDVQLKAMNQLISWRANDMPAGPKQLNGLIDKLLHGDTPPPIQGTRSGGGGMSQLASQVLAKAKATGKSLDKLDSATSDQFRIYLNNEPQQASDLVNLRNRLNQLLQDVSAGMVYLVQVPEGWLEYAPQGRSAGVIGFESQLEAAAEARANQGQVHEMGIQEAQSQAAGQNGQLWIAAVDGQIRPVN